jgi:uncharacterized protein involved in oxidation of intracellular sulfur
LETLTIIVNDPPYGTERVWNALRLASSLVSTTIGMNVNVFLLGDAVTAAKKGQNTPEGYYNLEQMLNDLVKKGVQISACGTCVQARGLNKDDLIGGVNIGSMLGLARWMKESQNALSF